jgi:hypothetical protein
MKPCSYCGKDNLDDATSCVICQTEFPDSQIGGRGYELGPQEKKRIGSLGSVMRLVGLFLILCSAVTLAGGFVHPEYFLGAVVGMALGALTISAGTAFRSAAAGQGDEIGHLIKGLHTLRNLYLFQLVLMVFGFAGGFLLAMSR